MSTILSSTKVSVIGLGFVGGSMYKSFNEKKVNVLGYDICKESDSFEECLKSDIMFLCLPTKYINSKNEYDKTPIIETCKKLTENHYQGAVVIKSTVEPTTTQSLSNQYPELNLIHNPEFLTAKTAYHDFHHQTHVVLGRTLNCSEEAFNMVSDFYKHHYDVEVSLGTSLESESMKSFVNCFYSVKVQFFSELYCLCEKMGCDYNVVKDMMLKNKWINPMHTTVPGPDGNISYGGLCFPKDTNALNQHMQRLSTPNAVLDACIKERNQMRDDHDNCD